MARIIVERNIAYDNVKKKYYVNLGFGIDEVGKHIKKTKTYKKISEARKALKEHEASKTMGLIVNSNKTTYYLHIAYLNLCE